MIRPLMERNFAQRLLDRFTSSPKIGEILASSLKANNNLAITNLKGGSGSALAAALAARRDRPILILTSSLERAEALADGMTFFGAAPLLFPALETLPFETVEPALHIASARATALAALLDYTGSDGDAPPPLLVVPADSIMHRLAPPEALARLQVTIKWGEPIDIDALAHDLAGLGYVRESMVESPGEFSIRGTIVDLYPTDAERPYRLDFFGDEIESIRSFDTATQRSIPLETEIESLRILARDSIAPALECLSEGKALGDFFALLAPETLLIIDGPSRVRQRIEYFERTAERHWEELGHRSDEDEPNFFRANGIDPKDWLLSAEEAIEALGKFQRIDWADLSIETEELTAGGAKSISVGAQSFESITLNFKSFLELITNKQSDDFMIVIACDNAGQASRLDELLGESNVSSVILGMPPPKQGDGQTPGSGTSTSPPARRQIEPAAHDVVILVGELHEGFIFPEARILVLTDREIFGRYKKRRIYRKIHHGKAIASPTEIHRGDLVVHTEHGIGRFERIRRQQIDGRLAEFLEIVYHDNDRLLVPIEKLHFVQKYSGASEKQPPLDRLGKKVWARRHAKTREAVHKLAGELLELYARRKAATRPPYGPDTVWQQEFEASFLYEETPDQLKAIREVKADLASDRPADRLICGDVGFGKTEVAIRAAFKALDNGRQVAVLAPTTILVQQHFTTFTERLADYPFKVGSLSRFRTASEQKETIAGLASGKINLVVGTHRLLSKDIKFANLGLLIIDEEQRFGVRQKERIKSFKTAVDVITLTATPIPRTLHLALARLRDLSLIQTPPADRLPIKTRTIHFERDHIEEAILRELNRGGQVFFVHNRIASIHEVARTIAEIVPNARICVGHGKLDEHELEKVMSEFIDGKFDILISTTIIENGIDIPNVNTIIINRADAFGLAQLYQLRGRVGREARQAYAYLILPRGEAITDSAMKRLSALEEFTELGMGFSIAMRDLEIRGTGNILGSEQSGAITDVGFDLYCKLLDEAVAELKGEAHGAPLWPTEVKWPCDQWLPELYIPVESQRIRFYKDVAAARYTDDILQIEEELVDRYGALPPEARGLLQASRVKIELAAWHIDTASAKATDRIRLACPDGARVLAGVLASRAKSEDWVDRVAVKGDTQVLIYLDETVQSDEETDRSAIVLDKFAALVADLPEREVTPRKAAAAGS